MLIDNETTKYRYYQILEDNCKEGTINTVSGYFTVGVLSYLKKLYNENVDEFKFLLGDIVSTENIKERAIDLLNENISLDNAFNISKEAIDAIDFIKQDKVKIKTLEPNFCHAKAYIFKHKLDKERENFYLIGSSNLTETGIGLRNTSNAELNVFGHGSSGEYAELVKWFDALWENKKASFDKTVDKKKVSFKTYLIDKISDIFKKYSPEQIYFKVLYELFGNDLRLENEDPNFNRQIGRLENSIIYKSLYDFQKKATKSIIKMIDKYNGAILADAVGLGKTWTALAVIKHYQLQNYDIIVLCPKKLEQNWEKFLYRRDSIFEEDKFDYVLRFHTDLREGGLDKNNITLEGFFQNNRKKLLVIDESHNLRNDKTKSYNFLVEQLLQKNEAINVLLLSATPINNSLIDVRNQFKLIAKGDDFGFNESLEIKSIFILFRSANECFNEWKTELNPTINSFVKRLKETDFFKLTDALTVSRTRKMIEGTVAGLVFPKKNKPLNYFVTPDKIGNFESFDELLECFPPNLSAYQPAFYTEQPKDVAVIYDEKLRDRFLAKMIYILMAKRLESSWFSFFSTVKKIRDYHQLVLDSLNNYKTKKEELINEVPDFFEEDETDFSEFTLGKKRSILISEIDKAGKLDVYKKDLKKDIQNLDTLVTNLQTFNTAIDKEKNHKSKDIKLEILIKKIAEKQNADNINKNKKILIFTVFKDTAVYIYYELIKRGFSNLAFISGDESRTFDSDTNIKKFNTILERFAPYTKLFKERTWNGFAIDKTISDNENFEMWKKWIFENKPETKFQLENPIDILIATDCLSEGQNLQDCDFVVNYDIHWNPVRVIQRLGRIDRLGSVNQEIFGLNFWPSDSINNYLKLQSRIEDRMVMMKLAGAEVDTEFTEKLKKKIENDKFEREQTEKMLLKLEKSYENIENNTNSISFDVLSLEAFRQDLSSQFDLQRNREIEQMPKAIYSGIVKNNNWLTQNGIVALIGYPSKPAGVRNFNYSSFDLIYIDKSGNPILNNQKEILNGLMQSKNQARNDNGLKFIDEGISSEIEILKNSIKTWLNNQAVKIVETQEGETIEVAGNDDLKLLQDLKKGKKSAKQKIKQGIAGSQKHNPNNCDLIVWLYVE